MFEPAYAGQFLKTYRPPINLNTMANILLTKSGKFIPSAIITREVQFPDVSFYQKEIDFSVMSRMTRAIIIRAGQNLWVDNQFERNYREAKRYGMLVGLYWFYDDRVSPGKQADLLRSITAGKTFELECFIDWENTYGGQYKGLQNVVAMMESTEKFINARDVGLYTGYYWFRANSNPVTNANQYNYLAKKPLWEAWYTSNPANVLIPAPWTHLTHWQFGTPVVFWGQQTSELDMNFHNGSARDFEMRYGTATPPPQGDAMQGTVRSTVTRGLNIRNSKGNVIAALWYNKNLGKGDQVYGPVDKDNKIFFGKVYRADGTIYTLPEEGNARVKDEFGTYLDLADVPEPGTPPPPPPPSEPTLTHTITVYSDGSIRIDDKPYP